MKGFGKTGMVAQASCLCVSTRPTCSVAGISRNDLRAKSGMRPRPSPAAVQNLSAIQTVFQKLTGKMPVPLK